MTADWSPKVGAVVLAAGMSRRMGQAKMTMPYRGSTVLGTVLTVLHSAGVSPLIPVIGGARQAVEVVIDELHFPVIKAVNPAPGESEMLDSLQIGMASLPADLDAFLVVIGDQPQIQASVVERILAEYRQTGSPLIIPSYQMRRGHPWLVGKEYWDELRNLPSGKTMRDFLNQNQERIQYLTVETPSILADLDTPEDYRRAVG